MPNVELSLILHVRLHRITSVCFVLLGLLSSGYFLNDGWLDEPKAPEKDSLVVEETETTQEFREEGRIDITIVPVRGESKACLYRKELTFSSALVSRFNCYKQKICIEDPPEDLRVILTSFTV